MDSIVKDGERPFAEFVNENGHMSISFDVLNVDKVTDMLKTMYAYNKDLREEFGLAISRIAPIDLLQVEELKTKTIAEEMKRHVAAMDEIQKRPHQQWIDETECLIEFYKTKQRFPRLGELGYLRDLKEFINDLAEFDLNSYSAEPFEVWIGDEDGLTNLVTDIRRLNTGDVLLSFKGKFDTGRTDG